MSMEEPTTVGEGQSGAMPGSRSVAIAGTTYKTAQVQGLELRINSVPALRPQSDISAEPGAQSLARDGLWRLSQSSWHRGAGQPWADRSDSDPFRFNDSRGIDVWTEGELSLLPTIVKEYDFGNRFDVPTGQGTVAKMHRVLSGLGAYRWLVLQTTEEVVYYDDNTSTWTDHPLTSGDLYEAYPSSAGAVLTLDGLETYLFHGAEVSSGDEGLFALNMATDTISDVWRENPGVGEYEFVPAAVTFGNELSFLNSHFDRLIGCYGADLVEWRPGLDARLIVEGHNRGLSTWSTSTANETHIFLGDYLAGVVYKTSVDPSTNETAAPSVAARLPDGEQCYSIYYYLGLVFIGTGDGFRVGAPDSSGNIIGLSDEVFLGAPVLHWSADGGFIWAYSNDGSVVSGGSGATFNGWYKINPLELNGAEPAYVSDLEMPLGDNAATSYTTNFVVFNGEKHMAMYDSVYVTDAEYEASGWLTTGRYELGAAGDTKRLHQAGVAVRGGYGDLDIDTYADDVVAANHANWPQSVTDSPARLEGYVTETSGAQVETRLTLTKGGTAPKTPTVSAFWSDISVKSDRVLQASIPIDLKTAGRSVEDTYNELEDFMEQGTPIVLQIDALKWTGWVSDINLLPGLNVLIVEMRIPL